MKKKYIVFAVFVTVGFYLTSCNNNAGTDKTDVVKNETSSIATEVIDTANTGTVMDHSKMDHGSMHKPKGPMGEMRMTGDFDFDFANTMMMHHQQAVDMAKDALPKLSTPAVKKIATTIIAAQEKEIATFKNILKQYVPSQTDRDGGNAVVKLTDNMKQMDEAMQAVVLTGNADKDFLAMMLPHHKSAVLMSIDELNFGKNDALKALALQIKNDQQKEISVFEGLLK